MRDRYWEKVDEICKRCKNYKYFKNPTLDEKKYYECLLCRWRLYVKLYEK